MDISDSGAESVEPADSMPDEFLPRLVAPKSNGDRVTGGRLMDVVDRLHPRPLTMLLPNRTADEAGLMRRAREVAHSVDILELRLAMQPIDRVDLTYRTATPDVDHQYATIERQGRLKSFRVLRVNEGLVQSDGIPPYESTFRECVLAGSFYRSDRVLDVALANAAVRDTLQRRERRHTIGLVGSMVPAGLFGIAAIGERPVSDLTGIGLAIGLVAATVAINRDLQFSQADRIDLAVGSAMTGERVAASMHFQSTPERRNMASQRFNIRTDDSSADVVTKLATGVLLNECDWPEIKTGLRAILRQGPSIADLD